MPADNLEVAIRIRTQLQEALADFRRLDQSLQRSGLAADEARGRMRRLGATLDGMVRGTTVLGRHVRYLATALTGVSAGRVLTDVVRNTIRQEQAIAQVEARIRATGGAAGLASAEIQHMAASLQEVTTFGDEVILEMQALLLSFRSLDGSQFGRISEAALDLATALRQGPLEAARQLGLALEDPVRGLTALRRSGTTFDPALAQHIRELAEAGRLAEAQTRILDELERQYGDAARAARDTLGGALQSLRNTWGDLLEHTDRTGEMRDAIEDLITALKDPQAARNVRLIGQTLFDVMRYMVENARTILGVAGAIAGAGTLSFLGLKGAAVGAAVGAYFAAGILAEEEGLQELDEAIRRLQERRAAALEQLAEIRRSGDGTTVAEQLADALALRAGGTPPDRDPARREAELLGEIARTDLLLRELEERQLAAADRAGLGDGRIRTPLPPRGAPPRPGVAPAPEPTPEAERYLRQLERQAEALRGLGHEERALAAIQQGRLGELTRAQRESILAAARGLDAARAAREAAREAGREAERTADLRTLTGELAGELAALAGPYAAARHAALAWREAQLGEVERLEAEGAATDGLRTRIEALAAARLADAEAAEAERQADVARRRLETATDWQSGATRALQRLQAETADVASLVEDSVVGAFARMEDALVRFVREGRLSFRSLADAILSDLTRLAVRQGVSGPLWAFLQNLLPVPGAPGGEPVPWLWRGQHTGGVAGVDGAVRTGIPAAAWWGAPRLHAGGLAGLAPDEIPTILRRGEGVFTPAQMDRLSTDRGPTEVRVEVLNRAAAPLQVVEQRAQVDAGRLLIGLVVDDIERGGRIPRALGVR